MNKMKSLPILTLIAALMLPALASAQSAKMTSAIESFLKRAERAETADQWRSIANSFERIANTEGGEWLAQYYAGWSNSMLAWTVEVDEVDAVLDKAEGYAAKAAELSPDNAEVLTLQSMLAVGRMRVDWSRGMTYGPKSTALLEEALAIDPDNPRALMNAAQGLINTPEAFGGNKVKGCEMLRESKKSFEAFEPESTIHPSWGYEYLVESMLPTCEGIE